MPHPHIGCTPFADWAEGQGEGAVGRSLEGGTYLRAVAVVLAIDPMIDAAADVVDSGVERRTAGVRGERRGWS